MATLSGKKRSTHEEDDEYTPSSKKKVRFERARHSRGGAGSSANAEEDTEDEDSLGDLSQVASQVLQEGDAAKRSDREAEIGVIEKIELRDFMCHKRLDVPLSPNVNFILGRNGSGKSAIMAAIMVALGGKASTTLRGRSLKQFIRGGCHSAEVCVVLRNRGREAYLPEKYGSKISIVRTLKVDGTGSYKLQGVSGSTVSTKKSDLVAVLDHCNIQIDNPVSLLNQDTSRNFLRSSNPEANYKLFMKATHLEQIVRDYESAQEQQGLMGEKIRQKNELVPEYEARAKQLEEQVEAFKRLKEMEEKIEDLEKERQWAIVIEIENTIPPFEKSIEQLEGRIPRNEQKIEAVQAEVVRVEEELRKIGEDLERMVDEASVAQQNRSDRLAEKRTKERAVISAQSALKATKRQIAEKTKEMKALEKARDDSIAASRRDYQGERETRQRRREEIDQKMKKVDEELATIENDRKQFEHALGTCRASVQENQGQVREVESVLKSSEERLRDLQSSRNDKLLVFGAWMRPLVNAIAQNSQRFRKQPKGPIGALIGLRDYRWAQCVEAILGRRFLYSFITDNQEDDRTLKNLMKQVLRGRQGFPPDTFVSRFEGTVYDVRENKPPSTYTTLLDMLDVQDPDIMNTLIDQAHVESILLIERRVEAANVIERVRPAKASKAYTIEGDEVSFGRFYSNKFRPMGIIKASVEDAISQEKSRLTKIKGDFDKLQEEGRRLHNDVSKNSRHMEIAKKRVWKAQNDKNRLQQDLMDLQTAEEEEETRVDVATYDGEIQECREGLEAMGRDRDRREAELKAAKDEVRECDRKISETDAGVDTVTEKMEDIKKRHSEVAQKKKRGEVRVKQFQDKVQGLRNEIRELESKISDARERARGLTEAALEVCPRIETTRSEKALKKEIDALQRRLRREEPNLERKEEIEQQYIEAMQLYDKTTEQIQEQKRALVELSRSLEVRISNYHFLQERIVERACLYFTHFLQQRDYDGKLRFNHDKQKLEIQVQVDTKSQSSQGTRNTRALSGGERSFTTVCFIMSLWDAIEAPFRCLDEFDVFMDLFNRRISMRLMLEHAEDQPNRQFIFFTPQDMSSVGLSTKANVKIFRLSEPERGQTTLD